jgi:cysteine synthase A
MALRLGDEAPDFTADSTDGTISFHDYIDGSWAVLFSHPKDYTPVCTTELGEVARLKGEFEKRGVKVLGLSVDSVSDHEGWAKDIEETQGTALNFPLLGDPDRKISDLYDMIHPNANDTLTVRSVFVIGPDKKVKLSITYPASTGRNFDEILRVIDSLQLTANHQVATPVNWKHGEDVIIVPALSDEEAKQKFPEGWDTVKPYLRVVRQPRFRGLILDVRDGFSETVGNTPLIRLRKVSEQTGCEILGKAEFLNPGGSVKDRAALYMILDAEERGDLKPGGVVVEGTAGNTGIGLALVGNARGYRTVILMPDTQSQEKKDMLRLCGAEVREVPAVPFKNPNHYVHQAERTAKELGETEDAGVLYANQWDNLANRDGHFKSTGPEIWDQTDGKVDGFVCAIGTGGTLSGVGLYLKERNPDVKIGLADPKGACMYEYFKHGEVKATEGSSISEGIGQGRVTGNVDGTPVDLPFSIPDDEALPIVFDLLKEEGLCLGGSTGINVAGAVRLAEELGPGHTIVTILCDGGQRYQSKLFNPAFLREKGLPTPSWL